MSTDNEMNSPERVLQERSRRTSIASLMLGSRDGGEDENTFTPEYDDPNALDPSNLALALGETDMLFYSKMVRIESPQVEPPATASLDSTTAPRLATATGGDATADALKSLMQHILSTKEDEAQRRGTLSQKDCAAMLLAVPPVTVDGQVLQGPKLLAWFNEVTSTYLEPAE